MPSMWRIVVAANAELVEITKFLAFAQNVIATVNDVAVTGNRNLAHRLPYPLRDGDTPSASMMNS
jgi:hypothetical protein